jgi:predicted permease
VCVSKNNIFQKFMSTLIIGASSVLRTLAVVGIGSFSATLLEDIGGTNSWFSVMNVYVFLPCLLFGHFSTTFSTQVFFEGLPLVIFGICRIFIGTFITKLAAMFGLLDDETQPLALLATSSSNAIAIPLAILGELVTRVDFLSDRQEYHVLDVQGNSVSSKNYVFSMMFVYAIPINFSIWSFGQFFIRTAVAKKHEKELREKQQQEQQQSNNSTLPKSISVGTDLSNVVAAHDESSAAVAATVTTTESEMSPISTIVAAAQSKTVEEKVAFAEEQRKESLLSYVFRVYILRSLSVPLVCSLGGIAVALIPNVQAGITGGWPFFTALSGVVVLLGSAAVPAALLTVGVTVYQTLTKKKTKKNVVEDQTTPTDDEKERRQTLSQKLTDFFGIQASLLITTSVVQLVITPLVAYILLRHLIFKSDFDFIAENSASNFAVFHSDPSQLMYWKKRRLMFFALLAESCCPSAMNTAIICVIYRYLSEEFSRMIVYQYILSAVTMALFISLALSTLQ